MKPTTKTNSTIPATLIQCHATENTDIPLGTTKKFSNSRGSEHPFLLAAEAVTSPRVSTVGDDVVPATTSMATTEEAETVPTAIVPLIINNPVELEMIRTLRNTYRQRLYDTIERCHNDGLPEEQILLSSLESFVSLNCSEKHEMSLVPEQEQNVLSSSTTETSAHKISVATTKEISTTTMASFPDYAIQALVHIVEGQSMPLDALAAMATNSLNQQYHSSDKSMDQNDNVPVTTKDTLLSPPATFHKAIVAAKLQLLATRNHLMKGVGTLITKAATKNCTGNVDDTAFATVLSLLDSNPMYRWEVVTPSTDSYTVFFPNVNCRTNVKKARTARKKIAMYCTTLAKMLALLSDIELPATKPQQGTNDSDDVNNKLWSRFRLDEERILKMDREYEANRIAEVARMEKLETDRKQKEMQQLKKAEAAAARQKEKEIKQQQLLQAKAEATQQQKILKESAALSKKTASSKKEKHDKVAANASKDVNLKQKQCMMSFFTKRTSGSPVAKQTDSPGMNTQISPEHEQPHSVQCTDHPTLETIQPGAPQDNRDPFARSNSDNPNDATTFLNYELFQKPFDAEAFRSGLTTTTSPLVADIQNIFSLTNLSARAKLSRLRRERISVPVFVTVHPSNDFDCDNPFLLQQQQPYAELVHVNIQNRYKFLSFYEDVRPPYYGTWSKKSKFITGKKPFGIDSLQLDYEVDSEGEWEEEEDDVGEEIGDDAMEDDEEKEFDEDDEDDEDDGWLAADDDIGDDDDDDADDDTDDVKLDEKTKMVSKGILKSSSKRDASPVCIISPYQGRPLSTYVVDAQAETDRIDGVRQCEALDLVDSFVAVQLCDTSFNIDAYPPPLIDDCSDSVDPHVGDKTQVMSDENMKTFVTFVQNCTYGSKDKVLDELLQTFPSLTTTRAQAHRVLDIVAEKRKHPCDGSYFWEVKSEVLGGLGLAGVEKVIKVENAKQEAMKVIVRCIHNSTFASKEKIVDEIRSNHEHVTASRAEAMRIVQSIATKAKHPNGGYYWTVNEDIRKDLGLDSYPNKCPLTGVSKLDEETGTTANQADLQNKRKHTSPTTPNEMINSADSERFNCEKNIEKLTTVNILPPRKKTKIDKECGSSTVLAAFGKKSALPILE